MSACSKIQNMLPVSPGDVSPEEYHRIIEHLESCPVCRAKQQDLLAVDQAAAEIGVPEPGSRYWDNFALRVRQRVLPEGTTERNRLIRWFVYRPAFGWPASAVALVLVFFLTRAMLPDQVAPPEPATLSEITTGAETDLQGPQPDTRSVEEEIVKLEPRTQPGIPGSQKKSTIDESAVDDTYSKDALTEEPPEFAVEGVAGETTTSPSMIKPSVFEPDAVPAEEMESILAARRAAEAEKVVPERQTIVLRGDTLGAKTDKDMPRGEDLARAERPNAPFPVGDTSTSFETQRILGTPGDREYAGLDRRPPTLNKDEFTAEDREFFRERIAALTKEFGEEKGDDHIKVCRELVDMHYQMALIWRDQAEIKNAVKFMAEARETLPEHEYPDLDAKAAALKSLIGE